MKRWFCFALALVLTLGLLAGCARSAEGDADPGDAANADPIQRALDAYSPDTVVMTIDGSPVRWDEYAFWLCSTAQTLSEEAGVSIIEDWNAVSDADTGETVGAALLDTVLEQEKQFHTLEAKAESYGLTLGEEGEAYVESSVSETMEMVNTMGEDNAEVLRQYYLDEDVLRYQAKVSYLYLLLYQELFGADGEKLSDEELNDYVAQNGYMTVRHILFSTQDETGAPLSDDEKARKYQQAQRIIDRLTGIEDTEDLLAQFQRYANEYNEDPGVEQYPNGYCFTSGEMDAAFEAASAALAPYAVSPEPVESAYGYHVILRVPTTGDDILDYNTDGTPYLLRSDAAQATYTQLAYAWIADAEVAWTDGFADLDLNTLFAEPEETFLEKLDVFHWFH